MRVLDTKVYEHHGFCSDAYLTVLMENVKDRENGLVYEQKGHMYLAINGDAVSYFGYHGPGDGYGGRKFTLDMADGTTKVLRGPYSGSASAAMAAGFPDIVDVTTYYLHGGYQKEDQHWTKGLGFAGAITLEAARRYLPEDYEFHKLYHPTWTNYGNKFNWIPVHKDHHKDCGEYRVVRNVRCDICDRRVYVPYGDGIAEAPITQEGQ